MKKGNVLVVGNSGVGKSTLINAVLGEDCAVTGYGDFGSTEHITIHENDDVPFRLIDTVGFTPEMKWKNKGIKAVQKWAKEMNKTEDEKGEINLIWFCVDGTSRRLFPETIEHLISATSAWRSVPVVVVITKSYAKPERDENIAMVREAFAAHKGKVNRPRAILPVVAQIFVIDDDAYAAPYGITDLIDVTNDLLPEGMQAAVQDISKYKLARKRTMATSVVAAATLSGVVAAAVPIPFPDAAVLVPIEAAAISKIANVYGIAKDDRLKQVANLFVELGVVTAAARGALVALKAVPGVNLGASVANAVVAGSVIAALGGTASYAFEQVYLGKRTMDDFEWFKERVDDIFVADFADKVGEAVRRIATEKDTKKIAKIIMDLFVNNKK